MSIGRALSSGGSGSPGVSAAAAAAVSIAEICGGSRARAHAASGDPFGEDPLCAYEPGQRGGGRGRGASEGAWPVSEQRQARHR